MIMKANELRIGNWIKFHDHERQIVGIGEHGIICTSEDGQGASSFTNMFLNPIPLTEDWLIKFGFGLKLGWTNKELSQVTGATISYGSFIKKWSLYSGHNCLNVQFEYVHQLQNLYFAITGVELEIT